METMDKSTARNILNSRVLIDDIGTVKNVQVTNVSFKDENGEPFKWEEDTTGSSAGEPYAIANFNAMNAYGRKKAIEQVKAGEYQEACNNNLSLRVTPELGQELREAMFATIVAGYREVTDPETDEKVQALLITKAVPLTPKSASDKRLNFDEAFGIEEEEAEHAEEGMRVN